jgi:hypothetical protein
MKLWMTIFGLLTALSTAHAETECSWNNFRDGVNFGSISNRTQLVNIFDCANAIGDYMLHGEPIRGSTMFDGTVWLKSSEGQVLGKCETKTIRPISEAERANLPFFLTVKNEAEGKRMSQVIPGIVWKTEEKSAEALRSEEWQAIFNQYFQLWCEAATS